MALPKKVRTGSDIITIREGSLLTSKEEIESLIIKMVTKLFTINSEIDNLDIPLTWYCDDFEPGLLLNKLNKIKGCEVMMIDNCDSINDIIRNNFKF